MILILLIKITLCICLEIHFSYLIYLNISLIKMNYKNIHIY